MSTNPREKVLYHLRTAHDSSMGPNKHVSFEDFLQEKYQESDNATDDPDKADDWICSLDLGDVIELAEEWGATLKKHD